METQRRDVTLRFLAQPVDVNFGGKVHGGSVMRWIDQAGYACAVRWSGHYCVTVYVGGIRFVIVFVAVNDHGNPTPVRPWTPQSPSEIAEHDSAVRLMEMRKGIEREESAS